MKIKITTLLLSFFCLTLFAQDDWKTLKEKEYSISYPNNWETSDQKIQENIEFILFSDENSNKEDLFRENINLTKEDLDGNDLTVEEYAKISLDVVYKQIKNIKVISNETVKLNELDAVEIVWSADFGNGAILKFKQVLIVNNKKAYVLTFSSSEAEYELYIETANKILNSFKLE